MKEMDFINRLCSSIVCGICGGDHEPTDVCALGCREDVWLFLTYCSSCGSLRLIVVQAKGRKGHKAVTGQAKADKSNFSTPISSSDLLDMHIFLKNYNGDFTTIINDEL